MRTKKSSAIRSARRTPEEVEQLVKEYHDSGMTQGQYAALLGVALSTLVRWLRSVRRRPRSATPLKPDFVEVDISAPRQAAGGVYQIELPGGVRLRAEGGWRAEQMRQLLSILQGL